jgi:hypothetical protein
VPADDVATVRRLIDGVVAELQLPRLTGDAVATDIRRWTPYRAEAVGDADPTSPADAPYYRALRERGFGAAIDVRVTKVGFAGRGGSDPGLGLRLDGEARLVDTATGAPVAVRGLVYLSPARDAAAWTRDGGALAQAELARARETLAERIVESLVLGTESAATTTGNLCGLEPKRPEVKWTGWTIGSGHVAPAVVPSLAPVLAWEGRPSSLSPGEARRMAKVAAADIRYDLRIWKTVDDGPGDIVYERDGLDRPEHQVETALEPESLYFWTVRLRYTSEGRVRATRWSAAVVPAFIPPMPLGDALYYSRPGDGTVKPVACHRANLTPCECLDFIPRQNFHRFRTPPAR